MYRRRSTTRYRPSAAFPSLADLGVGPRTVLNQPNAVIGIALLGDLGIEDDTDLLDLCLVTRRQPTALVQIHHVEANALLDGSRLGRSLGSAGVGQQQHHQDGAGGFYGDGPCGGLGCGLRVHQELLDL